MLSVTFKSIKLSVIFIMPIIIKLIGTLKSIMLSDVRLNVIMLRITLKSTMLSAVIPNGIMVSVVASVKYP